MIFPDPLLQLGFATLLEGARDRLLLSALRHTVGGLSISEIDRQLADYASDKTLSVLASRGIRGETIFALPVVLNAAPALLGYYRLLYGYSQKIFYTTKTGASALRLMEAKGIVTRRAAPKVEEACRAFAGAGEMLVEGLGKKLNGFEIAHELSLLTLGAQFRGSANNTRGTDGINALFAVLKRAFEDAIEKTGERTLLVRTPAGKQVVIQLASDPDVLIKSTMSDGQVRSVVAIEVKAGEDHSNIWNRIGEAEKSHVKIRSAGVNERWTVVNDPQASLAKLKSSSPSTTRFYQLLQLTDDSSEEFSDFRSRLRDLVGL